jgi:CHAD domain-containing protein
MAKAKEIIGLDCDAKATDVMKIVLLSRFDEMCAFREAALDFSDIEGVHDMRVASRRLRSALRDFLSFMQKDSLKNAGNDLKKIADALGEVRDHDVAIIALEDLKEEVGKQERGVKNGIEKLIEERNSVRDKARIVLAETITAETLSHLREDLKQALEKAVDESSEDIDFRKAGSIITKDLINDFLKLSESLYTPFRVK